MKNKILEMRKLGYSYVEICEELNCAKSTVSYHCNKNNLGNEFGNIIKSWDYSKLDIKRINELYEEGLTNRDIHMKLNGKLSLHKIELMTKIFRNKKPYNKIEMDKKVILEMQKSYDKLKSTRKVADKFKVSRHQVMKYVKVDKPMTKKEKDRKRSKDVMDWRRRTKIKLVEYKGGKCEKCGYKKCINAMEFHHEDPNEKDFTVSGKSWSFERLKKEVDKCILVCSNCHKEIHYLEKYGKLY